MEYPRRMTDVYHVTVAGMNPHDLAASMQQEDNPFYDAIGTASVAHQIIVEGQIVGGIVDV